MARYLFDADEAAGHILSTPTSERRDPASLEPGGTNRSGPRTTFKFRCEKAGLVEQRRYFLTEMSRTLPWQKGSRDKIEDWRSRYLTPDRTGKRVLGLCVKERIQKK